MSRSTRFTFACCTKWWSLLQGRSNTRWWTFDHWRLLRSCCRRSLLLRRIHICLLGLDDLQDFFPKWYPGYLFLSSTGRFAWRYGCDLLEDQSYGDWVVPQRRLCLVSSHKLDTSAFQSNVGRLPGLFGGEFRWHIYFKVYIAGKRETQILVINKVFNVQWKSPN